MSDHFVFKGTLYGQETVIFGEIAGAHEETCGFWHGWPCDCTPEMRATLERDHHPECDWQNSYSGTARCNCDSLERGRIQTAWRGLIGRLRHAIFRR